MSHFYVIMKSVIFLDPVREVIHSKVMISTASLIILLIPIMIFSLNYLRKIKCTLKKRENNRTNLLFNVTVEPFHLYSWRSRNLSKPKTESSVNVHLMFEVFGVFTNTHDYFEQKMLGWTDFTVLSIVFTHTTHVIKSHTHSINMTNVVIPKLSHDELWSVFITQV